jgi:hypothetical protein
MVSAKNPPLIRLSQANMAQFTPYLQPRPQDEPETPALHMSFHT